jgi:membrane protein insertase Oxa1/YidC/SpoIIIJ
MNDSQKGSGLTKFRNNGLLFLTFPQITLLIFVILLLILMVSVCIKFTKGPFNTSALQEHLQRLQAKFSAGILINPRTEREEMETLQNKIKTTSNPALISGNATLKRLLYSNCKAIQAVLGQPGLENRTSWIKLNALMVDFNDLYFEK